MTNKLWSVVMVFYRHFDSHSHRHAQKLLPLSTTILKQTKDSADNVQCFLHQIQHTRFEAYPAIIFKKGLCMTIFSLKILFLFKTASTWGPCAVLTWASIAHTDSNQLSNHSALFTSRPILQTVEPWLGLQTALLHENFPSRLALDEGQGKER